MTIVEVLYWILLLLFVIVGALLYLGARSKKRAFVASIIMAIPLAICAYNFVPNSNYDLAKHHKLAGQLSTVESADAFIMKTEKTDLEILPQAYSALIGKIGDVDLMQAIVVLVGYSMLFYMLIDYRNQKNIKNSAFIPAVLLAIFGQHILYYFSGLYNYLAINILAFATYCYYMKDMKKTAVCLCILSLFIHSSSIYPIALLVLFVLRKEKISLRLIAGLAIAIILLEYIMTFAIGVLNISALEGIRGTYDAYVKYNGRMVDKYDGFYLIMTVTKIFISLLACWVARSTMRNNKMGQLCILISVTMIMMSISSIAITRFSTLALYMAVPTIMDVTSSGKKSAKIMSFFTWTIGLMYAGYSIITIAPYIVLG